MYCYLKFNFFLGLHLNNKQSQNEEMFEWVPPNTTKELAEDYMKALPVERLPIKGSTGAALRKQQLQKQIPLHDIDYQACDELTDNEKIEFQQYLDNLKKCAGQGKVFKVTFLIILFHPEGLKFDSQSVFFFS